MPKFNELVESSAGSKLLLQGNGAFALGVIHAGYHAADGYPGTPSTEVIDKYLSQVQDSIRVGWSVSEAVAVGVGVGHAVAGHDTVVTMKIPGVFQAADVITTAAFYTTEMGALVFYAATDYVPSSTQHVIDARYFFAAARLPVLEPRNHQDMYDMAWIASDLSRQCKTPVVIAASGVLAHSDGLVVLKPRRTVTPRPIPPDLRQLMTMPSIARSNYNKVIQERMPALRTWVEQDPSGLVRETAGSDKWGIILCGESEIIVAEALHLVGVRPSLLSLAVANPLPQVRILEFARKVNGKLFVIEDGDRFLEEKIRALGIPVIGKEEQSIITDWNPELVLEFFARHVPLSYHTNKKTLAMKPVSRPPAICPGCPYRAFALAVSQLKKQQKIYAAFGDIGCSTLLHFLNALDTVLCMGASESMRQGFVMSRPEMAGQVISIIGDSCECHSGLDATRNAVFRNTPGVKIVLDNSVTAMTGGQPAPSSPTNLAGQPHKFLLQRAVEAEGCRTVTLDAYDLKEVEKALKEALELATQGQFSVLILQGLCMQQVDSKKKLRQIEHNYEKCKKCSRCNICPGIEADDSKTPHFTNLCAYCGSRTPVCKQRCPFGAIVPVTESEEKKDKPPVLPKVSDAKAGTLRKEALPAALRVAIRGIGGQGNLFFGKVLAEVALRTPYGAMQIVKGDTHGMAQLGGPVISTFGCGQVFSPVFAPASVDVLVVMELSEILRPGFLDLLKPEGTIIVNNFAALPANTRKEDYPKPADIEKELVGYHVIRLDANRIAYELGDKFGKIANVVVVGLLSTITPFNQIPEDIWLSALMTISPNELVKTQNMQAFQRGRQVI
jgi:indolepyruvate ferredoxin oxidoreductase alpha subunit